MGKILVNHFSTSRKVALFTSSGLEHATIRDNIIFASPYGYDENRYQSVLEACALVQDLDILDAGDMTGSDGGWVL